MTEKVKIVAVTGPTATGKTALAVKLANLFDAEIISWEYPEPIENSFKFVGISRLHAISMAAMLVIAFLTIIVCIIFVRKAKDLHYKALDAFSIAANFESEKNVLKTIESLICSSSFSNAS